MDEYYGKREKKKKMNRGAGKRVKELWKGEGMKGLVMGRIKRN